MTDKATGTLRSTKGFVLGLGLSLAGLAVGAATATEAAWRSLQGVPFPQPVWLIALRMGGAAALVLLGFCLMVLTVRDSARGTRQEAAAAASGEERLCARCGAANGHLARYCDQCGRKLDA
uniref:Zinc ribbon domain-containing protein n=1 Tax=Schlesneria paludicola TaxID=360056 RepID=A0A7C4QMM6_9PLAN